MTERNSRGPERRICKLAVVAGALGFTIFCPFIAALMADAVSPPTPGFDSVFRVINLLWVLSAPVALILGIVALVQINRNKQRLSGSGLAKWAVASGTISLVLIVFGTIAVWSKYRTGSPVWITMCKNNLHNLADGIATYTKENQTRYPDPETWCDSLLYWTQNAEKCFKCPDAMRQTGDGTCHYAINPACEPNSPPDTVLLFETKAGWNQSGGPEILTTENHNGKGCNVLFNDGSVKFVKTEELNKLKW